MRISKKGRARHFFENLEYAIVAGILIALLWPLRLILSNLEAFEYRSYAAPLSYITNSFQDSYPILATFFAIIILLLAGYQAAKSANGMRLYEIRNTIPFMMLIINVVSIVGCADYLTTSIIALLTTNALLSILKSFQPSNQNEQLFNGGFTLGLLPLFYPPAVALWVMMPLAVVIFSRTIRETIIFTIGLIIPTTALLYVNWLAGHSMFTLVDGFITSLNFDVRVGISNIKGWYSWFIIALISLTLLLSILFINITIERRRSRIRLFYTMVWFVMTIFSLYAASTNTSAVGLVAPAAAILIPISMLAMPERLSKFGFYIILILGIIGVVS